MQKCTYLRILAKMNSVSITIPGRLPGLNEYIDACREHRMRGAAVKKAAQEQCAWAMIDAKRKGIHFERCNVKITWYEKNGRRDPDNVSGFGRKVIFDALQQMGIIDNDGRKQIARITEFWEVDKYNPRIEITLMEVQND